MKRAITRAVFIASLPLAPAWLIGCSAPANDNSAVESGTVSLALVSVAGEHTYRLRSAFVDVYGPTVVYLRSTDEPGETALSATLPTGAYTAFLNSYWSLERDDGTGQFAHVEARLVSNPVVSFGIFNGTSTTISYDFETDGIIVSVGAGNLSVRVGVREVDAVCVPFGQDCPADTWCAPTGLTGAPRKCIPQGSVAIGESCSTPTDCVANASCFDFGDGAMCSALCPSSALGLGCTSGGTCQPGGADYGVCR